LVCDEQQQQATASKAGSCWPLRATAFEQPNFRIVAVEQANHSFADVKHLRELGKKFAEELEEFFRQLSLGSCELRDDRTAEVVREQRSRISRSREDGEE
jgi:hypothetical protein